MRVLLRADASPTQGTGHVMRCLTLSEELVRRGHEVTLMTNNSEIDWLHNAIEASQLRIVPSLQHELDINKCLMLSPDLVITDSYQIPAEQISLLAKRVLVLAIVDGDARGIIASKYLDHNLEAELINWPDYVSARILAGSQYALIRDKILIQKREQPWIFSSNAPHIVAVMGGSDPTGSMVLVAKTFALVDSEFTATLVVGKEWHKEIISIVGSLSHIKVISPTPGLPELLGGTDIAISASGTSSWELAYLGIPAILLAVVPNQIQGLKAMMNNNLTLGLDISGATNSSLQGKLLDNIEVLMSTSFLREKLSKSSMSIFDGFGKKRVVDELERLVQSSSSFSAVE